MNQQVTALIAKAKTALQGKPPLGGSILVNFGTDGLVLITEKNVVYPVPSLCNADCTITLSLAELADLEDGASVTWAVIDGALKIDGDRALAEKFAGILKSETP